MLPYYYYYYRQCLSCYRTLWAGNDWSHTEKVFFRSEQIWNICHINKPINLANPVPDAAYFQWACFDAFHWGFHYYLSLSTNTVSNAARETHTSTQSDLYETTDRKENDPWVRSNICLLSLLQSASRNTSALKASSPSLQATLPTQHQLIFTKMGKQQCSASALPSVTEWLDSRCCWQRFYSETAPPCRLCGGSPVCWVGALPPAHNVARGILHTTALLFGCHLRTICIWPHSNSAWARRLWRFFTCMGCIFVHLCYWFLSNAVLPWSNILPPILWNFFYVEINPASWDWKAHYGGDSEQKPH